MELPRYSEKGLPALLLPAGWRGYHRIGGVDAGTSTKRFLLAIAGFGTVFSLTLVLLHTLSIPVDMTDGTEQVGSTEQIGWTEQMGWTEPTDRNLTDLGDIAEGRYRLAIDQTERGQRDYFQLISTFAKHVPNLHLRNNLVHSIHSHLPASLEADFPAQGTKAIQPVSMISYKTIHQTDKEHDGGDLSKAWRDLNEPDGWSYNFLNDNQAAEWIADIWAGSNVEWSWQYMHRGVLRADFLRYLLILVRGGVYSDVDTRPIRRIEEWGTKAVETLDISATDGPDWQSKMSTHPAVVVAVDVDVHGYVNWQNQWPRALGICQWTLSAAPHHPIMIDAVRRVVNATKVVQNFDHWRIGEIHREKLIKSEGWEQRVTSLEGKHKEDAMSVMEWTGPGLFTDSVMAYLLARYNVTWHRFRALDHPLRIGEVMVLPITAFSPGGQPDFKAEGRDSPQANVLHNFRGGWKGGH